MAIATRRRRPDDNDIHDFHEQLKAILPRLRVYALSLTRDRDAADDLVHDTVIKALTGRQSFQPGTNLAAWLFRIQRNEFISGLRRQRPTVPVDTAIAESLSHPPIRKAAWSCASSCRPSPSLRRRSARRCCWPFSRACPTRSSPQHTGVSVGTVKSRISRARDTLERLLLEGDVKPRPATGRSHARRRLRDADEAQLDSER